MTCATPHFGLEACVSSAVAYAFALCVQTSTTSNESLATGADGVIDTEALEHVVRRMVDAFSIDGVSQSTSHPANKTSKSSRTLAGRKSTTVRAGDSVLHISVTESVNPYANAGTGSSLERRDQKVFPAGNTLFPIQESHIGPSKHALRHSVSAPATSQELGMTRQPHVHDSNLSLEQILSNPELSQIFLAFLQKSFSGENYTFWKDVSHTPRVFPRYLLSICPCLTHKCNTCGDIRLKIFGATRWQKHAHCVKITFPDQMLLA